MTDSTNTEQSAAVQTALDYHRAWTSGDFEQAMTFITDPIVCLAPAGRLEGAGAFRGFMGPFAQMLKRAELLAAYGDDSKAVLIYDTDIALVDGAPGAELLTVAGGRITHLRIIFDRVPFDAARAATPTNEAVRAR